ncbi:hypothetical protein FZEAL_2784 [Fusarium zealandicum]|uniref:Suppressor of anucleate metulae protein B n=1 Tax=Fusarium zealandicum TaxID=1053134 RepID=A0A8H4XMF2_9HYPO|nr:hypothetical protein FZEAL_2784 [Fusarium zealandicum]
MESSAPFTIKSHLKGRGLYASRPIAPGDVILPFTPTILIPSLSHVGTVCSYCFKSGDPRSCSRCHAVAYCGAACQSAAWTAVHSKECKVLRKVAAQGRPGLPTPVRAVVQALLKQEIGAALENLEGNVDAWRRSQKWADMEMMAMGASAFAGLGTAQEDVQKALTILCKIQTNAFHRYDADLGQVGIFLEPTLAMANHSCIPTAFVQFVGRKAILRAERPMQLNDEIEISYTVCTSSPVIDLNIHGLVSDLARLRNHPAVADHGTAKSCGEELAELVDAKEAPGSLEERRAVLRSRYRQCKKLVEANLWAVSPLPQVLAEISILYAEEGNFVYALATACYIAKECDPFRHVAPFHPVRVKGLFLIAKLLAHTAADTASLGNAVQASASKEYFSQRALQTLQDIDQVSLCQMLLIMILESVPKAYVEEWELSVSAKQMLEDINQLPGREQELSYINLWKEDTRGDQSRAFYEYAVLKQVDTLANLGLEVLTMDFGR